jgi:hypothetical protein
MTACCLDFGVELWTDFQAQRYLGGVDAISDCQGKKLPKKASGTVLSRAELWGEWVMGACGSFATLCRSYATYYQESFVLESFL